MISRVAESCFWLARYVERCDATARLLRVHSGMLLDTVLPPDRAWRPLLIVAGEAPTFEERFGSRASADGNAVQAYLTWDQGCGASILSSLHMARENARTVRETISVEMWNCLNAFWLWMCSEGARRLYEEERQVFYEEVSNRCHLFQGISQNTMLHEEPFDFMKLGINLERAGQTARVLDLQHHALGGTAKVPSEAVGAAEWIAILRTRAAYEPFFKKVRGPLDGPAVAEFLLLDTAFPASVRHALVRARNFLGRIRRSPEIGNESAALLEALCDSIESLDIDRALESGIHEVLTDIVDRLGAISYAVGQDYFYAVPLIRADGATRASVAPPNLERITSRLYRVTHTTTYRYASPVERSTHVFRLRPVHDRHQEVVEHDLSVSVPGISSEVEDVFGNQVVHFDTTEPYTSLEIVARSVVRVYAGADGGGGTPVRQMSIPILWMPWQSQMMLPYLLPPELEESELLELSAYARGFVDRNGHNLWATLLDLTRTLHGEMAYRPGMTQLETTPFEVYRVKHGVCQDFANLLICLARLERVPARYRVGYIHTGTDYENQMQADASHAWAEAYLPQQGWRGLDPTNGIAVGLDHIRVATGRNYRDATPTSGVIKGGGGGEQLSVSVRVDVLDESVATSDAAVTAAR